MSRRPEVVEDGDGQQIVDLGSIVSTLIVLGLVAGLTALGTVGLLAYQAKAEQEKVERIETDVDRQGRNQMRIDEQQRRIRQDTKHANLKLDALLTALDVPRIARPELPESSLEQPKPTDGG